MILTIDSCRKNAARNRLHSDLGRFCRFRKVIGIPKAGSGAESTIWKVTTLDKVLFRNQYLALIERNGYTFSREVRCDGILVSILPFRASSNEMEFLARLEVCPAHGPDLERCSITGGVEPEKSIEESARQELLEEAGYQVGVDDLINLGQVHPSKSADTIVHLFAVNVTGIPQFTASGDGTRFEANASVEWLDYDQSIQIADSLFVTAITRLIRLKRR